MGVTRPQGHSRAPARGPGRKRTKRRTIYGDYPASAAEGIGRGNEPSTKTSRRDKVFIGLPERERK